MIWESLILLAALTASALACMLPFYLLRGLRKLRGKKTSDETITPSVSIIVAAHNEEANIERCLLALCSQRYSQEKFEIIVIDDRSDDQTGAIIKTLVHRFAQLRTVCVTSTPANYAPKKFALLQGIHAASHEILFFTDADCIAQPDWIETMTQYFSDGVGVVLGYSPAEKKRGFLNAFYRLETLRTAAMMFGFAGNGAPYMSVGRNWAIRRSAFIEAGGYESTKQSLSGDDDLLLQAIVRKTHWRVASCLESRAQIFTQSKQTIRAYLRQKLRHFSASKYYAFPVQAVLGTTQILLATSLLLSVTSFFTTGSLMILTALAPIGLHAMCLIEMRRYSDASASATTLAESFAGFFFEPAYVLFSMVVGLLGVMKSPRWT